MYEILGEITPDMKFADLHMHTDRSDGHMTPFELVDLAVAGRILKAVAITDHNKVQPALDARSYAQDKGCELEVVVGSEITTVEGAHIVGLFLYRDIPRDKPAEWVIQDIHDQRGLAILPHPMLSTLSIARLPEVEVRRLFSRALNDFQRFDGFEVFNASIHDLMPKRNEEALDFFRRNLSGNTAPIGSSDGHMFSVGRAFAGYKRDLKDQIWQGTTVVACLTLAEQIKLMRQTREMLGEERMRPKARHEQLLRKIEEGFPYSWAFTV